MISAHIGVLGRARLWLLVVFVALLVGVLPSVAFGAVRYTSPTGGAPSAGQCTQAAPCNFVSALSGAGVADGDTVMVEPGTYPTIINSFETTLNVNVRGMGARPTDTVVSFLGQFFLRNSAATISNLSLNVKGVYGFGFLGTLADRLVVHSVGASLRACSIFAGVLRDSVCTSSGGIAAVFTQSYTEAPAAVSASLRNVTAYGAGGAYGLDVGATTSHPATINVTNSIIRSDTGVDVRAYDDQTPGATSTVVLDHSNFGSTQTAYPTDSVTSPGTGAGNQTAAPHFVNAGALDLHEAAGSPTIDAGTSSGVVPGELDADGNPRIVHGAPDIGAYEFSPSAPRNPVAAFSFSPSSATTGQTFSFDGRGSSDPNPGGSIRTYAWSFGDGASAFGPTARHAFSRARTYTVRLTVTDALGRSGSVSHKVTVNPRSGIVERAGAENQGNACRCSGETEMRSHKQSLLGRGQPHGEGPEG